MKKVSNHHLGWKKHKLEEKVIECFPFYSVVSALNLTVIDYFSLDIEGAELAILKTIPFNLILIRVFSIEFDLVNRVPGQDRELRKIMRDNGYNFAQDTSTGMARDYIFVHKSVQTRK